MSSQNDHSKAASNHTIGFTGYVHQCDMGIEYNTLHCTEQCVYLQHSPGINKSHVENARPVTISQTVFSPKYIHWKDGSSLIYRVEQHLLFSKRP